MSNNIEPLEKEREQVKNLLAECAGIFLSSAPFKDYFYEGAKAILQEQWVVVLPNLIEKKAMELLNDTANEYAQSALTDLNDNWRRCTNLKSEWREFSMAYKLGLSGKLVRLMKSPAIEFVRDSVTKYMFDIEKVELQEMLAKCVCVYLKDICAEATFVEAAVEAAEEIVQEVAEEIVQELAVDYGNDFVEQFVTEEICATATDDKDRLVEDITIEMLGELATECANAIIDDMGYDLVLLPKYNKALKDTFTQALEGNLMDKIVVDSQIHRWLKENDYLIAKETD